MTTETLVFLCVAGLATVHLLAPALFNMAQNGMSALLGARDEVDPIENVYGQRLDRANSNFKETLPLALGLLILVQVLSAQSDLSVVGAWLYFGARLAYLPLYLFGVPVARSAAWTASLVGLALLGVAIASV